MQPFCTDDPPYYSEVSSRQLTAPKPSTGKRTQGAYPIIHLLPGINEMSLVTTKQLINVHTAITGMAATVIIRKSKCSRVSK